MTKEEIKSDLNQMNLMMLDILAYLFEKDIVTQETYDALESLNIRLFRVQFLVENDRLWKSGDHTKPSISI